MRRKKAIMVNVFDAFGSRYDSYISHYEIINIPRFKHKKKPISMIKALEVRDKMERRKVFYNSETWKEKRNKNLTRNTLYLSVGGDTISINNLIATNLLSEF